MFRSLVIGVFAVSGLFFAQHVLAQGVESEGDKVFQQCNTSLLFQQLHDLKFVLGEPFVKDEFLVREQRDNRSYMVPDCAALTAAIDVLIVRVLQGEGGYSEDELRSYAPEREPAAAFSGCGSPIHHQGTNYKTVEAAGLCWFNEPLRTIVFADGTPIPEVRGNAEWAETKGAAWSVYDNVTQHADLVGLLYTGRAATAAEHGGVCPSGWRVSRAADWLALNRSYRNEPKALKSTRWDGTERSSLGLLPGGYRSAEDGSFEMWGSGGAFWTSESEGKLFSVSSGDVPHALVSQPLGTGASILCVSELPR